MIEQAIWDLLERVAGEEDAEAKAALRKETAPELGAHFDRHPDQLRELAYELLNIAWGDALKEDFLPSIIEVKNVGLTDIDYIETNLRGMRAYWQGKGGQIFSDILRYGRNQMPREEMVAALDYHQDDIRAKFWGAFDGLTAQSREKLRQLPVTRLVELIRAAIQGGPTFGQFAASTLTDDQVDSVVEPVAGKSDGDITIIGTRVATRKLAGVGLEFGNNIAEQIFRTGTIGVYKGYRVAQVQNFEDFAGLRVLRDDELWIVGKSAGRLTYYGDNAKVQQLQLPAFRGRWETARDAGMSLYGADMGRVGRIVLT
jgi:hypothetical protein